MAYIAEEVVFLNVALYLQEIGPRLHILVQHPSEHFPDPHNVRVSLLNIPDGCLNTLLLTVQPVLVAPQSAELQEDQSQRVAVAFEYLVVGEVVLLAIGCIEFRGEVKGSANHSPVLGHVADPDSSAGPHIAHFEVEGVFREDNDVGGFHVPVRQFYFLQVNEGVKKGCDEGKHIVF